MQIIFCRIAEASLWLLLMTWYVRISRINHALTHINNLIIGFAWLFAKHWFSRLCLLHTLASKFCDDSFKYLVWIDFARCRFLCVCEQNHTNELRLCRSHEEVTSLKKSLSEKEKECSEVKSQLDSIKTKVFSCFFTFAGLHFFKSELIIAFAILLKVSGYVKLSRPFAFVLIQ